MADAHVAEEVRVRDAEAADLPAVRRLMERAFSHHGDGEAHPSAAASPTALPPPPLSVVAEHRGRVVATATARVRGQWFGGRRTLCAAVGGVTVGVEARGRGVGRSLVARLLTRARAAGCVTSSLVPSTHRFYSTLGYGVGGRRPVYALSTAELRSLPPARVEGLVLRRAAPDDAASVAAMVRARAARSAGMLDHAAADEHAVEDPSGADSYVAEVDGVVRGWCAMGRTPPTSPHALYDLAVHDLLADDAAVELLMWRLLVGDHPSALRAVAVVPGGSLLEHALERQRDVVEDSSWMLRLVDVDAALAQRGYPACVTAELVLDVDDPLLPGGSGTRLLTVSGGVARVRRAPHAVADAALGVADLASIYSGHLDPLAARAQGRLRAPESTAAVLRALFAGPPAVLARAF